ncbi:DUF7706 family protein [Methylomonas sp. 11b]|uniref:DUF7706 family protein n=1 Tax=Methylomonas sp. 11b TaxID=1168169 RepID=UPI000564A857|nr:hypothetical protein [Methylomonas sp. 11b]
MTVSAGEICLSVSLSEQEAWDLAQFLKRTGFADFRSNAVDDGEAYPMQAVTQMIRRNLEVHGINPKEPEASFTDQFFDAVFTDC